MQKNFRTVLMSSDQCDPSTNFEYDDRNDADNVAILGDDNDSNENRKPMSKSRKICFYASIFLCIFVVFGFLWLVPCDKESCPAPSDRIKTHNWLNNYTKIELKGGVHIVTGLRSWENNLIFLYKGDVFFRESNRKRNGIISLVGTSGAVAWFDEMNDEPAAIDCTLIDVDSNGRPDCLVLDEYGALGAINPLSGQWHWYFKERSIHKVTMGDFPIMLPDLNGDGVLEILMVTSGASAQGKKGKQRNFLRILSGRKGEPIGEGYHMRECEVMHNLQLEGAQAINFSCLLHNNSVIQRSKTLAEVYSLITNKSIMGHKLRPTSKIMQHINNEQHKIADGQRYIYSLSGRELLIENRGKCPEDCNVTLVLSKTVDGKTSIIRNFTNVSGMYGHVPVQFHFKNPQTGDISGFALKFWKWNNPGSANINASAASNFHKWSTAAKKLSKSNSISKDKDNNSSKPNKSKNHTKRKKRQVFANFFEEFNIFQDQVEKQSIYNIIDRNNEEYAKTKLKRSLNNMTNPNSPNAVLFGSYKMQLITETVILVLFIGNDNNHIENVSQSNIVQFCRREKNEHYCQPDLKNQDKSLLIADLDQDGSQELLTYTSTFVKGAGDSSDWKLLTYVQLLRLEHELPALFEGQTAQTHN